MPGTEWIEPTAGLVGNLISSAFNAHEAEKAREWDEYFYKHRYQWQIEDLRAAGLNPILAATQGAGNVPAAAVGHAAGDLGSDLSSAFGVANAKKIQKEQLEEQKRLNTEIIAKNGSEILRNNEYINYLQESQRQMQHQERLFDAVVDYTIEHTDLLKVQNSRERQELENQRVTYKKIIEETNAIKQNIFESQQRTSTYSSLKAKYEAEAREADSSAAQKAAQAKLDNVNADLARERQNTERWNQKLIYHKSLESEARETLFDVLAQKGLLDLENENAPINQWLRRHGLRDMDISGAVNSLGSFAAPPTLR